MHQGGNCTAHSQVRPLYSCGWKGEPVATSARPSVHSIAMAKSITGSAQALMTGCRNKTHKGPSLIERSDLRMASTGMRLHELQSFRLPCRNTTYDDGSFDVACHFLDNIFSERSRMSRATDQNGWLDVVYDYTRWQGLSTFRRPLQYNEHSPSIKDKLGMLGFSRYQSLTSSSGRAYAN